MRRTKRIFQQLKSGRTCGKNRRHPMRSYWPFSPRFPEPRGQNAGRGDELLLASGGSARLSRDSVVREPLLVAVGH